MSNTNFGSNANLGNAAGEAKSEAEHLAEQAKAAAGQASSAVQDQAQKLASKASEIGGQVYERGVQASHAMGQTIEERPYMVAALAGAFGLLIGMALARR